MAIKPVLTNTAAFDATVGTTFNFGWKGAQAFSNELVIKDSETLAVVYKYKIETMALRHIMNVDGGTTSSDVTGEFVNGRQYQATLTVYDKYETSSWTSDPITFWCYSEPTLRITNPEIVVDGIVTMSSIYLSIEYRQSEGELLKEYTVSIYDSGRVLKNTPTVITAGSGMDNLIYKIDGLVNKTTYYVKVDGITYHGIRVSTDYQKFTVQYDRMGIGAAVTAKNIGDGTILISSNFKVTNAVSNPDPVQYINGSEVNLTGEDSYVEFTSGVDIGQSYELKARLRNMQEYGSITLYGDTGTVDITYLPFFTDSDMTVKKYYYRLFVDGAVPYTAMTKLMDKPTANTYVTLLVICKDGYYSVSVDFE